MQVEKLLKELTDLNDLKKEIKELNVKISKLEDSGLIRKFYNMKDCAAYYSINRATLLHRPYLLPNFGMPSFVTGTRCWPAAIFLDWVDNLPEHQDEWERMSLAQRKIIYESTQSRIEIAKMASKKQAA